jgi:hypothetical protein
VTTTKNAEIDCAIRPRANRSNKARKPATGPKSAVPLPSSDNAKPLKSSLFARTSRLHMTQFAKETLPISLEEEMRRSYLDYAMSVIVGRPCPMRATA